MSKQIIRPQQQSGAALIMALLLIAIVAAISTTIMVSQQVDVQRAILQNTANQAQLDMKYATLWWQQQLPQLILARQQQQQLPSWPQSLKATTLVDGDVIAATVTPATARFNLNNLALPVSPYLTIFANLIQETVANMDAATAQQIALNVQQWLTASSTSMQSSHIGAQYQIAHQPMASSSELRLVKGVTAPIYQALRPYIIALPENNTPIDINAASPQVLMAVLGLNSNAVQTVLQYRDAHNGFLTLSLFLGLDAVRDYL